MALPLRASLEDIITICTYLAGKPTGATIADAKAALGGPRLEPTCNCKEHRSSKSSNIC
jgi:hypothetical protein